MVPTNMTQITSKMPKLVSGKCSTTWKHQNH